MSAVVPARVLCADPPWQFGDKLPGPSRGAEKNYKVLSLDDIKKFPLPPIADDALLFMWRVSSQVEEAYEVVRAWGFVPKSEIVWVKKTKTGKRWFGMGRIVRAEHETCICAKRGRVDVLAKNIRSTFETDESEEGPDVFEAEVGIHSQKPEIFYTDIVEKLSAGPYVELFARRRREGWMSYGDQL